jgi:hydroxypyruvate reductase
VIARGRESARDLLADLFRVALTHVHGRRCVSQYLQLNRVAGNTAVIAIGKAAAAMMEGAMDVLRDDICAALVISPAGQKDDILDSDLRISRIVGNHPVPGRESLLAGEQLLDYLRSIPVDCELLFLISGGTSSLVEVPKAGIRLADLQKVNRWLLGSGLDIVRMNQVRTALSRIKGGQLSEHLGGRHTRVLLLSDVPGDEVGVIGSGLLYPVSPPPRDSLQVPGWLQQLLDALPKSETPATDIEHCIVATNLDALEAIAVRARQLGIDAAIGPAQLSGDVIEAADRIVVHLRSAAPGMYIWGGETTVNLPDNHGQGGRNQQLALAVADRLAGEPVVLLAAGTDGHDGCSEVAGAIIDSQTVRRGESTGLDAPDCLLRADAGSFLQASGDLFHTGPTGTNVMDIVIAVKLAEAVHG